MNKQNPEDKVISSVMAIFYECGETESEIKGVESSIEEIKKETRERAKESGFLENCYEEESFSLLYKEGESKREGIELNTAEQMMKEAFLLKREGFYTFLIDGSRDKEGNVL